MKKDNEICKGKNRKIVFFDIDGTLYTPQTSVPQTAIDGIKKMQANGHLAFICTGRSRSMIFPSMVDIGFDGIIAGAGTYGECNGQRLFRHDLKSEEIQSIVRKLREFGFLPVPEGHDYLYFEDESKRTEEYRRLYDKFCNEVGSAMRLIPDDDAGICAAKASASFTGSSKLREAEEYFSDKYTVINHSNVLLELIPHGFSKAEGIKSVISSLGFSREDTCAFGDSMNDYEMLEFVNDSVAMGNSDDRILKLAKYRTDTVENDGIYKGLEMLGLLD